MKKILCILTAALLCMSFCACGSKSFSYSVPVSTASENEDIPVVYVLSDGSPETGDEKTFSSYGELEKYINTSPVQAANLSNDSSVKSLYPAGAEKMTSDSSAAAKKPTPIIKLTSDETTDSASPSVQDSTSAADAASAAAQATAAAAQAAQAAVQASAAAEEAAAAAAKANALAASLGVTAPAQASVPASATASNAIVQNVAVTKSPYGETVVQGGSTYFVARANNCTYVKWTLVNWNASVIYDASDAPYYFPGVRVSGQGTDTLSFSNIPTSLNGWRVQAEFGGAGGPVWSDMAYLYVNTYVPKKNPTPCYPFNSWTTPCFGSYSDLSKAWTINYDPWGHAASYSENYLNPSKGFYPGTGFSGLPGGPSGGGKPPFDPYSAAPGAATIIPQMFPFG